jgi:site-specific DNA recombinase
MCAFVLPKCPEVHAAYETLKTRQNNSMNIKDNKPIKYLIYARRSTEDKKNQILSIESQIEELEKIAKENGLKVVGVFQESKSAKSLGRAVFKDVMDRIEKGEADGILCWKLDRLARNMVDAGRVINMLQMGAIRQIRTFGSNYYPGDNVLMMSVEFGMANQYSRDLAINVTRGLRKKAVMGWYPTTPTLGYLNSKTERKGEETILEDTERFALVRKMWDTMLTGAYSAKEIRVMASENWGLRMRSGAKMSQSNIYAVFTNTFYTGEFEYPKGSGDFYKGNHKAMITTDEYDKVQVLLGRKGRPRPKTHQFAFVGTMRCGECNMSITAEAKRKVQKNGNIHEYTYYHCTKHSSRACSQGSIEEKELKKQIDAELALLEIPESFHKWSLKWIKKELEKDKGTHGLTIESQQRAYGVVVRKIERLIDMRANEEITEEELRTKKATAMKEKERLSKLLADTDGRFNAWADNMETSLAFVAKARDRFNKGTMETRRRIFLAFGQNLMLKDRKVIFDQAKSYLPMKKLSAAVAEIHNPLEPRKSLANKGTVDSLYESSTLVCSRQESNLHLPLRRRLSYPLNDKSNRPEYRL